MPDQPAVMVRLGVMAQNNGELGEAVRQYCAPWRCSIATLRACCWRRLYGRRGGWREADAVFRARRGSRQILR